MFGAGFMGQGKIKLKSVLVALLAFTLIGSTVILMAVAINKQNETLADSKLQANFEGARNLSTTVNTIKDLMFHELGSTARLIADQQLAMEDVPALIGPLLGGDRLFNGALLADESGRVLAATPNAGIRLGSVLEKSATANALRAGRGPSVSDPFVNSDGHRVVMVSHPIQRPGEPPSKFIAGLIDLEGRNVFSDVFDHAIKSNAGTYAYIVDRHGELLLNPDGRRREVVVDAAALQSTFGDGKLRFATIDNAREGADLVGYLRVGDLGWGVVFQSPSAIVEQSKMAIMKAQLAWTVPLVAAFLLLCLWIGHRLASPFIQLTAMARNIAAGKRVEHLPLQEGHWNYEAHHLSQAMMKAVQGLQTQADEMSLQARTDNLTGLANRTGLEEWLMERRSMPGGYTLLVIDIDHFKGVNDKFGHHIGDETLVHLARILQAESGADDFVCRLGGEEFIVLLPAASLDTGTMLAERVRRKAERSISPTGSPITVSIGVAQCAEDASDFEQVFQQADQALYEAKRTGRNRTKAAG
ncbi:sensor domain-containing diguanylate cyclase [Paenibacillus sp. MMS18-CY102]|uniref:sensor domain-containing diguanylate cyclase n=1 Tax=Paenibacillus sp. MMS18-CY102 TaxID=2682849 RepID=UPI001365E415|nr:sensor domain-containing diguanylate cyclase [Paenibacillus sp. MMS18-CY102]MWC29666.1 diguanylate cyclase [Paenibacillus sp. MMS18-CY102]